VSRKWKNWYQNEVDEETKGADSRDKVKIKLASMDLLSRKSSANPEMRFRDG